MPFRVCILFVLSAFSCFYEATSQNQDQLDSLDNKASVQIEVLPGNLILGWADWVGSEVRCYKSSEPGMGESCLTNAAVFPAEMKTLRNGTRVWIFGEDGQRLFTVSASKVRTNKEPCYRTNRVDSQKRGITRGFSCVN